MRVCNLCKGTGVVKGLHNWKSGGTREQKCWGCHESEDAAPALTQAAAIAAGAVDAELPECTPEEYRNNILEGVALWLHGRSHTVWAEKFGHTGLMQTWAKDLRKIAGELRASHGQAPAQPDCLTCNDHGAVGNILTAEPCPDCPPTDQPIACSYGDNGYACCEGGPCQADLHNDQIVPQAAQQAPSTPASGGAKQPNICIDCANADFYGLPDKPCCKSCQGGNNWQPLNTSSVNPHTKVAK